MSNILTYGDTTTIIVYIKYYLTLLFILYVIYKYDDVGVGDQTNNTLLIKSLKNNLTICKNVIPRVSELL